MDSKIVRLRTPFNGKYVQVIPGTFGQGLFDGSKYTYVDNPDANCDFTLTQPDSLFALMPTAAPDEYLGADATNFGASLENQLYTKKSRAGYESWMVEHTSDGVLLVTYINYQVATGNRPYTSVQLTVEVQ